MFISTNTLGCNGNIVSTECLDKALSIKGPSDVGSVGQCPSPAYKSNTNCCCGNGCCWNKCTWDNPPDDCLEGVIKGQWMFDTNKGYFTAVKYWSGSGMNYFVISFPFSYCFLYDRCLLPILSETESLNLQKMKSSRLL